MEMWDNIHMNFFQAENQFYHYALSPRLIWIGPEAFKNKQKHHIPWDENLHGAFQNLHNRMKNINGKD